MKFETSDIRNAALVGHGGCGKTSLAEAILFYAKAIDRLGKVDDSNSTMDFDPEETKRNISISSSFFDFEWEKKKVNLIDTPGDADFSTEAQISLSVSDNAVVVVDAVGGVEIQTENMFKRAEEFGIPRMIFISKLDRERADFDRTFEAIKGAFKGRFAAMTYPIGKEAAFSGVVDLISGKALNYANDTSGKFTEDEIPAELSSVIEDLKGEMIESIAESDDSLLEKYLDTGQLSQEELSMGLKEGVKNGNLVPVFCGSGLKNIGVKPLLDFLANIAASPMERKPFKAKDSVSGGDVEVKADPDAPAAALIFKTIADPYAGKLSVFRVVSGTIKADSTIFNSTKGSKERIGQIMHMRGKEQKPTNTAPAGDIAAVAKLKDTVTGDTLVDESRKVVFPGFKIPPHIMSFALVPKSKGDEDKIMTSIHRLIEEDPTLKIHRNDETRELLLSGMGQVHLEVIIAKLKSKFGVDVDLLVPKVPYKETIKGKARVQGKYKKQTGGKGQYGDTWIEIEPQPRGKGFEFVDKIVGGVIPRQYIPACEKGIVEAMAGGVIAGYPVVDVKVGLVDGSYHNVDSSEMAFKIAASLGFKKGFKECKPVILEPIMKMEIVVSEDNVGDVMGDLNSRRGKVAGVDSKEGIQIITAFVPMAEVLSYAPDLRSITSGRGTFTMEIDHYEEVPAQLMDKIVEAAQKEGEE
ncbi:MAG: elongation factor G [Deltaproteobacteria bacterium]|uniref:Elongation factor G n=1 Tax=Candidatus Zymogenus saltonus TaxID=2844893 RepID=A0A9D8PPY0_9DELT|nr:elongation factor G [Candidatus Zymogenus saltonus]